MSEPRIVSNAVSDFQGGGLYPGGTGIIKDIRYVTSWTYENKVAAGSALTVMCKFQPLDGSNENKELDIPWSAGTAGADFQPTPDGGRVMALGTRDALSESTNWASVQKALRDQCGLDDKLLNGPQGILVLIGSQVTLVRKEQAKRDGLEDQKDKVGKDGKKFTPTFLCPLKATFPWDQKGQKRDAPAATVNGAAHVPTAAPTSIAGNSLGDVIRAAIDINGGTPIPMDQLAQKIAEILPKFPSVKRSEKMEFLKTAKDIDLLDPVALAAGLVIADDNSSIGLG